MAKIIKLGSRQFDLKTITVEPVMFLYMFSAFFMNITFQALVYKKVCIRSFNTTVCSNIENKTFKVEEDYVQKTTSTWLLYSNLAMGLPSLVTVVLFLGPWGDRVGRKIPVITPLIGGLLAALNNIVNSVYIDAPVEYLLIGNFLNGLFGGFVAALMSMYSYIAHFATPGNRIIRIGILEAMVFLSGTIGTVLSGVILDHTSYAFVFSLIGSLMIVALIYTFIWVDNIKPEENMSTNSENKGVCQTFFLDSLKDMFVCVYDKRKSKTFLLLALLIVIIFFLMLVAVGESDIILVYTRHRPFEWSQTTLGLYKGTESFLRGITVLTILPLMKRKFKARDTTLLIMGLVSKTAALTVLGIGGSTAVLFIGAVSGTFQGFGSAGIRSLCSGMVSNNEQAKLYSLIGMFESFATLAATSLFNTLYNATLDFYQGFCFLLGAGLIGCCILIAIFLHVRMSGDAPVDYDSLQEEISTQEVTVENINVQTDSELQT